MISNMLKVTGHAVFVTLLVFIAISGAVELYQLDLCLDVVSNFDYCALYLQGAIKHVAFRCCQGLVNLKDITEQEGPTRVCECIEDIALHQLHISYNSTRIRTLYTACSIHLNFPISERMNCSSLIPPALM